MMTDANEMRKTEIAIRSVGLAMEIAAREAIDFPTCASMSDAYDVNPSTYSFFSAAVTDALSAAIRAGSGSAE
jgi:hypothetical protein